MDTEIDDLLRFNTEERKTTAGLWLKKPRHDSHHPDHICGNVMVRCIGERGRLGDYIFWDWRIFIRLKTEWIMVRPPSRTYGYGSAGVAKIASRLIGNRHGKGPHKPRSRVSR